MASEHQQLHSPHPNPAARVYALIHKRERTRHSQSHSQFDDSVETSAGRRAFNNSGCDAVVVVGVVRGRRATHTTADTARQQLVNSAPPGPGELLSHTTAALVIQATALACGFTIRMRSVSLPFESVPVIRILKRRQFTQSQQAHTTQCARTICHAP